MLGNTARELLELSRARSEQLRMCRRAGLMFCNAFPICTDLRFIEPTYGTRSPTSAIRRNIFGPNDPRVADVLSSHSPAHDADISKHQICLPPAKAIIDRHAQTPALTRGIATDLARSDIYEYHTDAPLWPTSILALDPRTHLRRICGGLRLTAQFVPRHLTRNKAKLKGARYLQNNVYARSIPCFTVPCTRP